MADEPEAEQCVTCRHWAEMRLPTSARLPWNAEANIPDDGTRWGHCKLIGFPRNLTGGSGAERAYVIDGSEYWAGLQTRSDFGCVEHEPEENDA